FDFDVQIGSISAILAGNAALIKTTAGLVTISGANTYGGATTVNAGTLRLGASNVLPDTTDLTVNGFSTTFDVGTFSDQVNSVALLNGDITGSGTLTALGTTDFDVEN